MFGCNGEVLVLVIVVSLLVDCFDFVLEVVCIVIIYCMLVFLFLDGYLVNGFELWWVFDFEVLFEMVVELVVVFNVVDDVGEFVFYLYLCDFEIFVCLWVVLGMVGLEYCVGGIEKVDVIGNISYDFDNYDCMVWLC